MLEMDKKTSFLMVTTINYGQMDLKIKFTRYCFSVFTNIFELHLAII